MTDHHEPDNGQCATLELADGHFLHEEGLLADAAQFVRRLADDVRNQRATTGPQP